MLTYILFVAGFVLLIKGADLLVDGASSIARRLNISNIVIGLTIVAFGTSAPELVVNLIASIEGNTDIAIGNILGSNIANIFLILGVSALIYPITANKNTVLKEIPFSLLAAVLVGFTANDMLFDNSDTSVITRIDGLVYLLFFIVFFYYIFGITKSDSDMPEKEYKDYSTAKSAVYIILGLTGLVIGGKWIVEGAISIAQLLNMSEAVIGLTVVAVGTSLPELATSAVAAYKRESDIAIGNVVGSNIFNIFWILGISAVIHPLPFETSSNIDIIMVILASVVLFFAMYVGRRHTLQRWQGIIMILIYAAYVVYRIMNQ